MSKKTFPYWTDDWMKAQQEYVNSWASISEKMASTLQPPKKPRNPWIEAMEQWETVMPGNTETDPYLQQMLDQGKAFFEMSNDISDFMKLLNDVNTSTEEWQRNLRAQMDQMKAAFESGQGEMAAFWKQPMDAFKNAWGGEGLSPETMMSGAFMPGFSPKQGMDALYAPFYAEWEKLIDAPGVGPDREEQERFKQSTRLWVNYQKALTDYNSAHQQVGKDTIDRLTEKLIEMSEKNENVESMRAVYDLWVDCAEEAYADFAMSEKYQDVYANLVNSMMALKQAFKERVNDTARAMGLPTQAGFNTILKRMQEMRREMRSMKKQGKTDSDNNAEVDSLKVELKSLQDEIATLKSAIADLTADKPADKPAAPRKKRAAKKTTAKSTKE